jgi:hypothetical protein
MKFEEMKSNFYLGLTLYALLKLRFQESDSFSTIYPLHCETTPTLVVFFFILAKWMCAWM